MNLLRHRQEILMVSTLSQQRYCEKKVDLTMQYPGVEPTSPAMEIGTEGHAHLEEGAIPIGREEIDASLRQGKSLTLFEFPMEGVWEEIPIWGRPDLVQLKGRSARLLIEFKFSRRSNLFPSQQTQANLYGWLLRQNRFEVDSLLCAVAIFPATISHLKPLPTDLIEKLLQVTEQLRAKTFRSAVPILRQESLFTLHLFPFRPEIAERDLRWAVDYWREKREPEPSGSINKCRICRFNAEALCDQALASFAG
jgi:hypothetical protein